MNIRIIAVGKLKESYWRDAVAEYSKRLSRFCRLDVVEVKESPLPANASPADELAVKEAEGSDILSKIKKGDYVIALEISGKALSSTAMSEHIRRLAVDGESSLVFIIGGSLGLSKAVLDRANYKLSFSNMTFPHQMMRVILLEQLYRSYKIINNEAYHK